MLIELYGQNSRSYRRVGVIRNGEAWTIAVYQLQVPLFASDMKITEAIDVPLSQGVIEYCVCLRSAGATVTAKFASSSFCHACKGLVDVNGEQLQKALVKAFSTPNVTYSWIAEDADFRRVV